MRAAVIFYGVVGLLFALFALWKCGRASFVRGLALGAPASALMLTCLYLLQRTALYTTF